MKAIIGFIRYQGEIRIGTKDNRTSEAKRILGYIPELPALYPNLTVSEHMEFLARAYRLTNYKERIDDLLSRFELDDKHRKFGDEMSKGMQQKLNICMGLLPEPKIILMDEPMIGLDPHAIKELKNLMGNMRSEGKTVLISTHMIDSVDMLWDQAVIMQTGCVKAIVTREELAQKGKTLEELFFEVTEGVEMEHMRSDFAPEGKRQ